MGTFFIDHQVDNLKQITVRKTVDRIGNYGFSNNSYVEKTMQSETAELYIEIEEGVESIGEGAFWYTTAITSVKLPQPGCRQAYLTLPLATLRLRNPRRL